MDTSRNVAISLSLVIALRGLTRWNEITFRVQLRPNLPFAPPFRVSADRSAYTAAQPRVKRARLAKAVRVHFLRDLSEEQLAEAFKEGFGANAREKAPAQKSNLLPN